jgi:uncharacterized protein (TIGR01777 family)
MKSDRGRYAMLDPMLRPSSLPPPEKIGISRACLFGGSGLIGRSVAAALAREDVEVTSYRRRTGRKSTNKHASEPSDAPSEERGVAYWDPSSGTLDIGPLERAEAVINFTGESLADGVWTKSKKQRLWSSRVDTTALIASRIASFSRKPKVLINASAVGFYGPRAVDHVTEESLRGTGFLAELCEAWEAATRPAKDAGIRVVNLRLGVVLTPDGGVLAKMVPVFRKGLGGRFGDGSQPMPWITLTDAVGVVRFAIAHPELEGPVNVVAPDLITNAQLTEALSRALGKPARVPLPAFALKLLLGEMANETLLGGARVHPRQLEIAGYRFEYPRLDDALPALFNPNRASFRPSAT